MNHMPDESNLPDTEMDQLVQYRDLSRMAVIAFVCGLMSWLALLAPLFWFVPVVTLLVAWRALQQIERPDLNLAGRRLVSIAVILACLFAAWGTSRYFARQWMLNREARAYAQQWLEMVREGRLREAHQLHLPYGMRMRADQSYDAVYSETAGARDESTPMMMRMQEDMNARARMERFFEQEPLVQLVELGDRGSVHFVRNVGQRKEAASEAAIVVGQLFRVDYEEQGEPQSLSLLIITRRTWQPHLNQAHWQVESVLDPAEVE